MAKNIRDMRNHVVATTSAIRERVKKFRDLKTLEDADRIGEKVEALIDTLHDAVELAVTTGVSVRGQGVLGRLLNVHIQLGPDEEEA